MSFLKNFLTFENMITPKIVGIIYWLSIIATTLSGLVIMFSSFGHYGNVGMFFSGLFTIVFGVIVIRISCELILLAFNIYEKLKVIAENTSKTE